MNLFDYLLWRGDIPFSVDPFNEVDNLVLSELAYSDFSGIVPEAGSPVALPDAFDLLPVKSSWPGNPLRPGRPS